MNNCVALIFRKPFKDYHSIENIFDTIIDNKPETFCAEKIMCKYLSKGILRRFIDAVRVALLPHDVLHVTGDNNFLVLGTIRKKTIITVHSFDSVVSGNSLKKMIYRFFWFRLPLSKVTHLTVVSNYLKNELLCNLNIHTDKISVILNPLNPVFRPAYKFFNKKKPTILQVGAFDIKNIHRLAEAIKDMKCHLRIIGNLSDGLKNSLISLNIDFSNTSDLSPIEMLTEYQNADIVTLISLYEGFGMPIIEANAVGRAVITANCSSMPEVANDAALLVNPYDIEGIRDGINKLIHDDSYRDELIANGFENVKRFDIRDISQQYYKLYEKIMTS